MIENSNLHINKFENSINFINNLDDYRNIKKGKNIINVLIFVAEWCGPCKRIKPFINETIIKYKNKTKNIKKVNFIYVNIDKCLPLSEHFNISLLPTIIITQNCKEEYRLLNKNTDTLLDCLDNLLT